MKPTVRSFLDLMELATRYRGHPAAVTSLWSADVMLDLRPGDFRAHGPFVFQDRHDATVYRRCYEELARRYPDLTGRAHEDGLFGARCETWEGKAISRDLLDSVAEIGFLRSSAGTLAGMNVVDIGAGYGRLGHRLNELGPADCRVRCVDGVAESSFVCDFYLRFRGCDRATMIPLDEIESSLAREPASIACNVHSFPEMPLATIEWWLGLLAEHEVRALFIVPNEIGHLRSTEVDGRRHDFSSLLRRYGFSLAHQALKYDAAASSSDDSVLYQDAHMLFLR